MRLGDDDENEGNARETVPGLHAQQVQELRESKYRRLRPHDFRDRKLVKQLPATRSDGEGHPLSVAPRPVIGLSSGVSLPTPK